MWAIFAFALLITADGDPSFTEGKVHKPGFFDLYYEESSGSLFLAIDTFDSPFLFVNSLATGLGSNDIGLDRGQLGQHRLVSFKRVGKRVFLIQENLHYRADSDNPAERAAVADSFAQATLWGAEIAAEENGQVYVDLDTLIYRDEHNLSARLQAAGEGSYGLDKGRSFLYLPRTKAFPENTEVEVSLTFTGSATGPYVPTVAPDQRALTMRHHYSFIKLPEQPAEVRHWNPGAGGIEHIWRDYAQPLDADLDQRVAIRHRLIRKNPKAKRSKLVEPLIYYVDSGAPPEIRDALIEGASWWKEAFEAAGIIDGFQVKVLPEGVDPMDVRYNVIQWVHRSTRGWSYGSSIFDPRTGEILKGHVTLGSLRVRQDRLLFEGMLPRDEKGNFPKGQDPVALALARIRQLSAHEVGHTLGFAHNFTASNASRSSVMDYPAPLVRLVDGKLDTSDVYDRGIGEWDKVAAHCIYGQFDDDIAGQQRVLAEAGAKGLHFVADQHSRSPASMHPDAHLWDNGADALTEMERLMELRSWLLDRFGPHNLGRNEVAARLEEVLVPVYLSHRYQLLAVAKSVGGASFDYGTNDGQPHQRTVAADRQRQALALLFKTMTPEFLALPEHLRNLIPPRPPGFDRHRELFDTRTYPGFDELALTETGTQLTLNVLLVPARLNRLHTQQALDANQPGMADLLHGLLQPIAEKPEGIHGAQRRQINYQVVDRLLKLVRDTSLREDVRAEIYGALHQLYVKISELRGTTIWGTHYTWLVQKLEVMADEKGLFDPSKPLKIPPGSPI